LDIKSNDSAKQDMAKLFWTAFRNEIGILEACSGHPNIIQILGRAADYSQILLEKADMDLNTRLRASGTSLSLDQCHRWSKDLLCGVGHLHALGVSVSSRVLRVRDALSHSWHRDPD
jgi:serine/threonine protein kinase